MKHVKWINRLRYRFAWWAMPQDAVTAEKRRLEEIARDMGVSRSAAKALAATYFRTLKRT
jgi:hypothetical protein